MQRRQFVKNAAGLLVLGPTFVELVACSTDSKNGNTAGVGGGSGTGAGTAAGAGAGTTAVGSGGSSGGSGTGSGSGGVGGSGSGMDASADATIGNDSATRTDLDAGSDASGFDAAGACVNGAQDTAVTDQHNSPHHIMLTMSQVLAATEGDYSIKGLAKHDHKIHLSAAHFATLATGGGVTVTSTTDMGADLHNHEVTLHCA